MDKKFEGLDDCMICFSVIHGSNYSLPKLSCKTCKKKFHSACLYRWFSTSNNSTCPLCRNLFWNERENCWGRWVLKFWWVHRGLRIMSLVYTKAVIILWVNPKSANLILEIRLGLGFGLGPKLGLWLIRVNRNPNLISRTKFMYVGFTEHGIITTKAGQRCSPW